MNFLFLVADFPKMSKANVNIAYKLREEITKKNHDVFVYGKYENLVDNDIPLNNITIKYINDVIVNNSENTSEFKKYRLINHHKRKIKGYEFIYDEMICQIPRIIDEYSIDCIISFSYPHQLNKVLLNKKISVPICLYILDPYSSHFTKKRLKLFLQFKEYYINRNAFKIFTTDLIESDYCNSVFLKRLKKKIKVVEFPQVNHEVYKNTNTNTKIIINYFGSLYSDIRNPQKFLYELSKVNLPNIEVNFYGLLYNFDSKDIDMLKEKYRFVNFLPGIDAKELKNEINNSDFLLNIGNTIENQMPSKIIEYINTGKPIINYVFSRQCPTLKYTNRYSNVLNIINGNENIDVLKGFLLHNKGKLIDKDAILNDFHDCTCEYVADILISSMEV